MEVRCRGRGWDQGEGQVRNRVWIKWSMEDKEVYGNGVDIKA